MDNWRRSEFAAAEDEPLGPLANLVDIILVFACGLIAALVAISPDLRQRFQAMPMQQDISLGRELTEAPPQVEQQMGLGDGYESLGQVYRDPDTGKLILISE